MYVQLAGALLPGLALPVGRLSEQVLSCSQADHARLLVGLAPAVRVHYCVCTIGVTIPRSRRASVDYLQPLAELV